MDINKLIEKDFEWMSPIEKEKMRKLIVGVWNEAVDLSASRVEAEISLLQPPYSPNNTERMEFGIFTLSKVEDSINALKLK